MTGPDPHIDQLAARLGEAARQEAGGHQAGGHVAAGHEAGGPGAPRRGPAPVELWDPPYCGDIGLSIDAGGAWHYRGSPIQRPALAALFARVLRADPDGQHYLVTPAEKVDVKVADAPFIAVGMEVTGTGSGQWLRFITTFEDAVVCGPDHPLSFMHVEDFGTKPYVHVRGRLLARLTRSLTHELLALAVAREAAGSSEAAKFGIWSGGAFFPLP